MTRIESHRDPVMAAHSQLPTCTFSFVLQKTELCLQACSDLYQHKQGPTNCFCVALKTTRVQPQCHTDKGLKPHVTT